MSNCWLIGAGPMALDYAKVLIAQGTDFVVVGRGESSANNFYDKTGKRVITGGLNKFLESKPAIPKNVIVAVGVTELSHVCHVLIKHGIKRILLEKPGGLNLQEIKSLRDAAKENGVIILLGYNRRFYSSVLAAKKIIQEDGGVTSFTFEFTEWTHVIKDLPFSKEIKENWLLANSSHVIDMAFFMGGKPKNIHTLVSGALDWHPSASAFCGCGETSDGAIFSYHSNWAAPGRWGVEILTKNSRMIFRPLEKLSIQKIGSVQISEVAIEDKIDTEFKPGLYLQVENFLKEKKLDFFCDIDEQCENAGIYDRINGKKEQGERYVV